MSRIEDGRPTWRPHNEDSERGHDSVRCHMPGIVGASGEGNGVMKTAGCQASPQAQGWYRTSRSGGLPKSYSRFVSLWEALCAWFRDVKNISNDRQMKNWLKEHLGDWHKHKLGEPEYGASVQELKRVSPIGVMKGPERVGERGITDESDCGQIVDVIYTVRCNLVKGGKPANPDDREIEVCEAASQVLDPIVKRLVF